MPTIRFHYTLLAATTMLLLVGIANQHQVVRSTIQKAWHTESPSDTAISGKTPNTLSPSR